jgi:hypothetical protein
MHVRIKEEDISKALESSVKMGLLYVMNQGS